MIRLKNKTEIAILRAGGRHLARILAQVAERVMPGVKTGDLDDLATTLIKKSGDRAAFKNYRLEGSPLAYPTSLCTSVNEEVVHGIPSNRVLKEGDLVGLDLGLEHKGLFTDMAITVPVGKIDDRLARLLKTTREALDLGIAAARPGGRIGDIGAAVENCLVKAGYGVVKELAGHGVGFAPHEDPFVPNFGPAGQGEKLKPGLVIAIEPMACLGSGEVKFERDGFTFTTRDKQPSTHFEHTVAITKNGVEILTAA